MDRYWKSKTEAVGERPVLLPLFRHKFNMHWTGTNPGPPRWEAGDKPSQSR